MPTRTRIVRVSGAIARRGGRAAVGAALSERHTMAAVVTAGAFGYMTRPGSAALPHIAALGQAGTYGMALWAVGRFGKSRMAQHMATGLLCVQAAEWARGAATTTAAPTTTLGGMSGIL
jgi:hypothetical protein